MQHVAGDEEIERLAWKTEFMKAIPKETLIMNVVRICCMVRQA